LASIELYAGQPGQVIRAYEGASQSYKAGDLVRFVLGYVKVGAATEINAIALKDATGTTGAATEVELINCESLYLAYNSGTIAIADIGDTCTWTFTAGAHTFAVAASDAEAAHVVMIPSTTTVGASGGYEVIQFNPTYVKNDRYHAS
jgi:plastocyanin